MTDILGVIRLVLRILLDGLLVYWLITSVMKKKDKEDKDNEDET